MKGAATASTFRPWLQRAVRAVQALSDSSARLGAARRSADQFAGPGLAMSAASGKPGSPAARSDPIRVWFRYCQTQASEQASSPAPGQLLGRSN